MLGSLCTFAQNKLVAWSGMLLLLPLQPFFQHVNAYCCAPKPLSALPLQPLLLFQPP